MAVNAPAQTTIHNGYYTVSLDYGHRTFRIRFEEWANKQVIAFLNGTDNTSDYTSFGFIQSGKLIPWKRFSTGYCTILDAARFLIEPGSHQEAAGKRYAQGSGCCYACGRLLTDPLSIELGIGPYCRNK